MFRGHDERRYNMISFSFHPLKRMEEEIICNRLSHRMVYDWHVSDSLLLESHASHHPMGNTSRLERMSLPCDIETVPS